MKMDFDYYYKMNFNNENENGFWLLQNEWMLQNIKINVTKS